MYIMLAAPRALGQRLGVNPDPGHVNSGAAGEGPSSPLMSAALPSHKCEARSNIGGGETIPGER